MAYIVKNKWLQRLTRRSLCRSRTTKQNCPDITRSYVHARLIVFLVAKHLIVVLPMAATMTVADLPILMLMMVAMIMMVAVVVVVIVMVVVAVVTMSPGACNQH